MRRPAPILILAAALAVAALVGCASTSSFEPASQRVRSERVATPASESVTIDGAEGVVVKPDGVITASAGRVTRTRTDAAESLTSEAEFTGSAVRTSSAEAASRIRSGSPEMTAQSIGGASMSALSELASGGGLSFFYVMGVVLVVAGAGIGYFGKSLRLGLSVAALGLLIIGVGVTIDRWPWVWLVLVLAVAGVGAYVLWINRAAFRDRLALDTVVRAVERTPEDARRQVKIAVGRTANGSKPTVDRAVDAAKARAGVGGA